MYPFLICGNKNHVAHFTTLTNFDFLYLNNFILLLLKLIISLYLEGCQFDYLVNIKRRTTWTPKT